MNFLSGDGHRGEEPQPAYLMSFTWASHIAVSVLMERSTLPNQSNFGCNFCNLSYGVSPQNSILVRDKIQKFIAVTEHPLAVMSGEANFIPETNC